MEKSKVPENILVRHRPFNWLGRTRLYKTPLNLVNTRYRTGYVVDRFFSLKFIYMRCSNAAHVVPSTQYVAIR